MSATLRLDGQTSLSPKVTNTVALTGFEIADLLFVAFGDDRYIALVS